MSECVIFMFSQRPFVIFYLSSILMLLFFNESRNTLSGSRLLSDSGVFNGYGI